jgi:5-methylcytosine-specific restriction endonuclease McrA
MGTPESNRKYNSTHPEKVREAKKKWRLAHPGYHSAYGKKWNHLNRDKQREALREWRRLNPEKAREQYRRNSRTHAQRKRRATVKASSPRECLAKIARLLRERFCHWCCVRLTPDTIEIDHVVPLSRGGKHEPDNFVAACCWCNRSKHNKLIGEWEWKLAA